MKHSVVSWRQVKITSFEEEQDDEIFPHTSMNCVLVMRHISAKWPEDGRLISGNVGAIDLLDGCHSCNK